MEIVSSIARIMTIVYSHTSRLVLTVFTFLSEYFTKCVIRLSLWSITVVGSLVPPLYAADVQPSFEIYDMAMKVNDAGLFRDLFYVLVVISLIGFCEILGVFFKFEKPGNPTIVLYVLGFASFTYGILYGITEFSHLANISQKGNSIPMQRVDYDFTVLVWAGVIGIMLELLLAFRSE